MSERTYRDVDVDLDHLADSLVDWLLKDGFEVQDFQEGSSILVQARKENAINRLTFTGQAVNIRLTPQSRGFRAEVKPGDWLDKGIAAGASAVAIRFLPVVGVGATLATGYGLYQQLRLPEQVLDYVDTYLDQHAVSIETQEATRRPRRGRDLTDSDDTPPRRPGRAELDDDSPPRAASASTGFCPQCGVGIRGGANFCHACGQDLRDLKDRRPVAPAADQETDDDRPRRPAADEPADGPD